MKQDRKQNRTWVQSLTEAFNEKSAAHLSVDLQAFYCDPKHSHNKFCDNREVYRAEVVAQKVGEFVRAQNRQRLITIWAAHNCASSYGMPPMHAKMYLPQLARESFYTSLPVNDNDLVICKENFSAFDGTRLDDVLKMKNIKTLFLSGVFLDVCIHETARDAKKLGYDVYVLKDLTISVSSTQEANKHNMKKLQKETGAGVISPRLVSQIAAGKFSTAPK